ncbi:MAG: hypothetical protein LCH93_00795 [Proteobacteria bacterium]|nr:hypothetical protein [Pseudomonadota bacterium]
MAGVGDDTCGVWKSLQRRNVAAAIVIDHLDLIPTGMRDEYSPGRRVESAVIER